jgi:Zn-dependent peptidase ImmA (M78 family)
MSKLRAGFTAEAESIAEGSRAELRIRNIDRLDPLRLAGRLEIPVLSLRQLASMDIAAPDLEEAIELLHGAEQDALSALTVFDGSRRMILFNSEHTAARQVSDIMHELAHGLLLHKPAPALDDRGCRSWNTVVEDEANYLGGALLIPAKAARWVAKLGMSEDATARRFGCSVEMVRWRLNASGARRLIKSR